MAACVYPEAKPAASHPGFFDRAYDARALVAVLGALALTLLLTVAAYAAAPSLEAAWRSGGKDGKELTLTVTLESGWHLNANDPDRPFLIPTTLEIDPPAGTTIESITYPAAVVHALAFATGMPLRLYEGTFAIRVRVAGAVPRRFEARLGYQACNDETCLPPKTLAVPFDATTAKVTQ